MSDSPLQVSEHVDFIKPGVKLSAPLKKRQITKRSSVGNPRHGHHPHSYPPHYPGWHMPPAAGQLPADLQNCGVNITPTCIKALYDIPTAHLDTAEDGKWSHYRMMAIKAARFDCGSRYGSV